MRHFRIIATPVLTPDGVLTGVIEVVEDLTARKRVEEHLHGLNDCFLGFGPDIGSNINRLTAVVGQVLEGCCALYNRLGDGMLCSIGQWQAPVDFRAEDRADGHICHDVIRQQGGAPLLVRHLQTSRYAETDPNVSRYGLQTYVGVPVFQGQTAIGSLCVVYDRDVEPTSDELSFLAIAAAAIGVEESRRLAVEQLRQREEFIQKILDTVEQGFLVIDRELRIITANRAACEWLGEPQEAIIGSSCFHKFHSNAVPFFELGEDCAVRRAFATGESQLIVHRQTDSRGHVRYLENRAFPMRDGSGAISSAIETISDITERYQLEAEQLKSQKLEAIGTLAGGSPTISTTCCRGCSATCRSPGWSSTTAPRRWKCWARPRLRWTARPI